jgi:hypothetical protein
MHCWDCCQRRPKLANLLVQDNVVNGVGVEYQGSSGIHLFSAINASLRHNLVAHNPYTALTIVWPVRCTISSRIFHSRMPLYHTHVRLKRT